MNFLPAIIAFIIVFAQPVLGWRAIPEYFDFSPVAGSILGVADGILLGIGIGWTMYLCLRRT
jgi:hypothetical protein